MPLSIDAVLALLVFAVAATMTPGPNTFMLASSGATFGIGRTLPHILGITFGFPFMMFAVTLGLGELFREVPMLRTGVALVGFCVMLWLAYRIATQPVGEAAGRGQPLSFLTAAAFQWVNPKAWVMTIGVGATYMTGVAPTREALAIAALFAMVLLVACVLWTALGVGMGRVLGGGMAMRVFNVVMAALLALSALWILLDR
ncbi:MAG: LysE family translocator [Pseudomonadota bacterium]